MAGRQEMAGLALLVLVIAVSAAAIARGWFRRRPDAKELEQRRRNSIYLTGKLGDGEIIDVEAGTIVYSYHVAGVEYTAAQDVTGLEQFLPADKMMLIGPISIKFMPRNPANSIVVCEEWSGLRNRGPA